MRVLVVEDSAAYRELVIQVATDIGLDALGAACAEDALKLCESETIDLMIVDLNLGAMDGLELCRRIRKTEDLGLIPIILLTADQGDQLQQRAFDSGVSEMITKAEDAALRTALEAFVQRIQRKISGRVLYIEDSRAVADLTLAYLEDAGLTVDHFKAADNALSCFQENTFDLIISDIVVEGSLSGIGLLRAVRLLKDTRRDTPFLALSGSGDAHRRVIALRQGADDFISKPVYREELLARAANLIAKKRLMDQVLEQQEELRQRAITDELSGLYNKAYLGATGRQMLASSIRHRYPLSVLVIDLDHFKRVNDQHGHDVGDKVLRKIGGLLKQNCRNEDLAARFGGEEFVLLLPHCSLSNARAKAESLRLEIEALNPVGIGTTASIGVSCTRKDENNDYETLFKQADQAVYEAKAEGRNCTVTYSAHKVSNSA